MKSRIITTLLLPTFIFTAFSLTFDNTNSKQNNQRTDTSNNYCADNLTSETHHTNMKLRFQISKIIPPQNPHWVGDGFKVFPVFGEYAFQQKHGLSPFLMFDYAAPKEFQPNKRKPLGVGQHPHRGFETVTIAFQGEVEHADSTGNVDVIKSGDVQWMTAGRGIIHQEFHSKEFSKTGGMFEMCQLWVNLPKKYKMTKPRYQPIQSKDIPSVKLHQNGSNSDDSVTGTVRIIAGSFDGVKGPAKTFSPVELWDINLSRKGQVIDLPFPENYNCLIFVRRGEINVHTNGEDGITHEDDQVYALPPQAVAIMKNQNGSNTITLSARQKNSSVLIMGGEPIDEPMAARGPFVMNTWDEIRQAMFDFQNGKMGQ